MVTFDKPATLVALSNLVSQERSQILPSSVKTAHVAHYSLPAFDSGQLPEVCAPASIKSGKFLFSGEAVLFSKLNLVTPRVWNVIVDPRMEALASTEFLVLKSRGEVTAAEIWAICSQASFTENLLEKSTGTSNSPWLQPVEAFDVGCSVGQDTRCARNVGVG